MNTPVFHSYDKWRLSGVNTWTVNLIRGMEGTEFDSKVLFTGIPNSVQPELDDLRIPYDFLNLPQFRSRKQEWRALKEYLEARAPCLYITNYDFHRSCSVGTFNSSVKVALGVRSDELCYFDEVSRIGANSDAIFCVSSHLTNKVKEKFPELSNRVHFIPHGLSILTELPCIRPCPPPIRLCYCNRLSQYQKRVFDLPLIALELERIGVNYELHIAGDGPDAEELRSRFKFENLHCLIRFHGQLSNDDVINLCRDSHVFLLVSDFEGFPNSLLEAMSVGCVPVVYHIDSGINDIIQDGVSGLVVPHGNTMLIANTIRNLVEDWESFQRMSLSCSQSVANRFSLDRMVDAYLRLFRNIRDSNRTLLRTGDVRVPYDISIRGRLEKLSKNLLSKSFAH